MKEILNEETEISFSGTTFLHNSEQVTPRVEANTGQGKAWGHEREKVEAKRKVNFLTNGSPALPGDEG